MTTETTILVTDDGFAPAAPATNAVETIGPADDPAALADRLADLDLIRVEFPKFSDGRGFTHARTLRRMGFSGRLHATGHVIADQYAMARRSGFDAVEIDADLARRQPEDQWRARADWRAHDYQSRLRG
jgi:uncharacterized protein (DUF934 family)